MAHTSFVPKSKMVKKNYPLLYFTMVWYDVSKARRNPLVIIGILVVEECLCTKTIEKATDFRGYSTKRQI
jgi:hypothetical protein